VADLADQLLASVDQQSDHIREKHTDFPE
jgi:hypothetical protein